MQPTVVIAPHPDDETLGVGGLVAAQRRRGLPVVVVAISDGEAAYSDTDGLGCIRRVEQQRSLAELGVDSCDIVHLGLPDGAITACEDELVDLLRPLVNADSLLVAPWLRDPHPDHEACGRAAQRLAHSTGATLVSYLFWAWHHDRVEALTALPLHRFDLDEQLQATRAAALAHHRSQLEHKTGPPILPDSLLGPARRPFEIFIIHD